MISGQCENLIAFMILKHFDGFSWFLEKPHDFWIFWHIFMISGQCKSLMIFKHFDGFSWFLGIPTITSKTRETAFQILNRTIWTNNKAYKSRLRPDPYCERCKRVETMEHLLCECEYYSEPLWNKLAESLTRLLNDVSLDEVPRVELGQTNIIFNIPHPSLLLHIQDKPSRNAILLLIQEIKRDLIYRRMNLPPSAQQVTDPRRLAAHVDSTIRRLRSYLQYIGLMKYKKADDLLSRLQECNLA
jgi:hypothetical protein